MKGPWAVLLIAAILAGCRNSQPATNPFLRTTVPPPGTAPGMMVMPGETPPPVATPPVVTPGAPDASPPAVSPAVPVTPGQPAPLIAPPPPLGPQEKFQPPGGSYLYHQSSNDRPGSRHWVHRTKGPGAGDRRHVQVGAQSGRPSIRFPAIVA